MISKEDVLKIAKLSRLELTETEVEKMQKDLSSVLDYFDILKKAPAPVKDSAVKTSSDGLRADMVEEKPASLAHNLVAQAPDKKDDYIKVKSIL